MLIDVQTMNWKVFLEDEKLQCQNGEACVGILVIAVADQQVSVIQMMERLSLKHRPTFFDFIIRPFWHLFRKVFVTL